MKTTILILLAAVSIARANLVDLTPGGFNPDNGFPTPFTTLFLLEKTHRISYFDSATTTGWLNNGDLNGGTYFSASLSGPSANVSWDFSALPGYSMRMLLVEGERWDSIYAIPLISPSKFLYAGTVTLHDALDIQFVEFFGRTPNSRPVPESGSTLAMMGIGLLGMFVFARRCRA